jgi:hypothetical protein
MPDNKDDLKEIFGTYDPETMLNQVQDTLSADSEILKGETKQLRKLAEGNKAMNAIQMADAARSWLKFETGQKNSDDFIETALNKVNERTLTEFDDAKRGRTDLARQMHDSEVRIRKDIRSQLAPSKLAPVTQKLNKAGDTRGMHPNSQANQFKKSEEYGEPTPGRTGEVAEAIRIGAMPTALGSNKSVVAATKTLGAFTKGISTDGAVDSDKLAALHAELDTDKNLKSTFENYLQAARKVTSTVNPNEKDVHAFERHRDTLKATGKFQSFDDDLLNSRMTMKEKLMGMLPGKDLPHIQFAKDVKEVQRQTGLKEDSATRARTRAEMFGDPIDTRTGIDDEGGETVKELKKISKSTQETSSKLDGMGGSLLGVLVAAMGIWALFKVGNTKVNDVRDGLGLGPNGMDDAVTGVQKLPGTGLSLAEKILRKTPFIGKPIVNATAKLTQPVFDAVKSGGSNLLEGASKQGKNIVNKIIGEGTEEAVEASAEKIVKESSEKVIQEGGEEIAEKVLKEGTETAVKNGAKASAMIAKKFPILGLVIGTGFAGYRLAKGDAEGAAMEMASGIASTVPGYGTGLSVLADGGLILRDIMRMDLDDAKDKGLFNKAYYGNSSIDKTRDWTKAQAEAVLEFEDDDLSESDINFLKGVIETANVNTSGAIENTQDAYKDAQLTTNNNVTVNNLQEVALKQPEVQVVASVPQAGISSKSHSFQRLNDQTFGPSYG